MKLEEVDLKNMEPAAEVDTLGLACPYPLLKVKKAVDKLSPGQLLKAHIDSESTIKDTIPPYCEKQGYPLQIVKLEDKDQWEVYILKK
jgi:TusA-related sulfurtransferase